MSLILAPSNIFVGLSKMPRRMIGVAMIAMIILKLVMIRRLVIHASALIYRLRIEIDGIWLAAHRSTA